MADRIKVAPDGINIEGKGVGVVSSILDRSQSVTRTIGTIIGLLGTDWLRMKRWDISMRRFEDRPHLAEIIASDPDIQAELSNLEAVAARATTLKAERGEEALSLPSLKMRAALIEGISLENDPTLQELWARLLARATSGNEPLEDTSFAETIKQFQPQDAILFRALYLDEDDSGWALREFHTIEEITLFKTGVDGVDDPILAADRLARMECVRIASMLEDREEVIIGQGLGIRVRDISPQLVQEALSEIYRQAGLRTIGPTAFGDALATQIADTE